MPNDERRSAPDSGWRTELGASSQLHPPTPPCIIPTGWRCAKATISAGHNSYLFLHLLPVCTCRQLSLWVLIWHGSWSQGPEGKGHFSSPPAHRKKPTEVLADWVPAASKEVWVGVRGFMSAMASTITDPGQWSYVLIWAWTDSSRHFHCLHSPH